MENEKSEWADVAARAARDLSTQDRVQQVPNSTHPAKLSQDKMNTSIPAEDWKVYKRDKCRCQYCDFCGFGNFDVWVNLPIDHIVPKRHGGDDTAENKAVACYECNMVKGSYVPVGNNRGERIADARRYVQGRREQWRSVFEKLMTELGEIS
ncbi:MAG: HNH endonuclease signature motif containing protein [Terriglobales bacterium]